MSTTFDWFGKSLEEALEALLKHNEQMAEKWSLLPVRSRTDPPGNQFCEDFEELQMLLVVVRGKQSECPAPPSEKPKLTASDGRELCLARKARHAAK
jgi:hypothetical protein